MRILVILVMSLLFAVSQAYTYERSQNLPELCFSCHHGRVSFRDIPGVTMEDVAAIEEIQRNIEYFVLGARPGTELFYNENDELRGYVYLLSLWLEQLFGIPFKPKIFEWGEIFNGLGDGRIDFTSELTATDERRQRYFMTDPIAERLTKYFRLENSEPLEAIAAKRPLNLAFLGGGMVYRNVTERSPFGFKPVFVNDNYTAYLMLKNGEVDAFMSQEIAEAVFNEYGGVVAENFYPLTYAPVSLSTQIPHLEPIINVVQLALEHGGNKRLVMLYNIGRQDYMRQKLFALLTDEEREFIRKNRVVSFAAYHDAYPITFYREGEWQGVAFDVLEDVANLTGLTFELANRNDASKTELLGIIRGGKAQMIASASAISGISPGNRVIMQDFYTLVSGADYREIKFNEISYEFVGLVRDTKYANLFTLWFPEHRRTIIFDSHDEAFDALSRGEVTLVMTSLHELLRMTNYLERPGYRANLIFNYTFDIRFWFNENQTVLLSIMDKAIGMVDTNEISGHWMRKTYDHRLKMLQQRLPYLIGTIVLGFIAVVLIFIVFLRGREKKRLRALVKDRTAELELQTAKMKAIMNSVPDLVFVKDIELKFMQVNRAFENYVGVKQEEIVGQTDKNTKNISKDAMKRYNEWDEIVLSEKKMYIYEEVIYRYDGFRGIFEMIKLPMVQNDVIIGIVGIARNINKRKAMEEQVLAASNAKSAFLANMSHEIRTPMNSIMGFSELALDEYMSPKVRDYLNNILENSKLLLQIINDVLDISKIESGKMELEHIPFDLHDIFVRCETMIYPKVLEKGIQIHFYAEPSVGRKLIGDPVRLSQVLLNILSNAVKFTSVGVVKMAASIRDTTDGTTTILFEIKDSGIGMSSEQIRKVFEPFVQADSTTTRRFGGTGLGLPISKSMIEMMGGKLMVESQQGIGSKFSFEITFATIDIEDHEVDQRIATSQIEKPVFKGEILLCEDNKLNQRVAVEHLAKVGLKTVVAENGLEGVNIVRSRAEKGEKPFDLIFMDIHMPVMDGLEAADEINNLEIGTPIAAMTANIMASDRVAYRAHGMVDFIGKPFTAQELWHLLLRYFEPVDGTIPQQDHINRNVDDYHDEKFQRQLQADFAKDNKNRYTEIVEALDSGNIKLAYRLVHTLKSNAGLFNKKRLADIAAIIEDQLQNGQTLIKVDILRDLETELSLTLDEFTPPKQETVYADIKTISNEEALVLLEKVEPLLKQSCTTVLEFLDALRTIPGGERLVEQIDDFDFKPALDTLTQLKQKFEKR